MLVLPCAVLALSAFALSVPSEHERDILGLLGGTNGTSSTTQPQNRTRQPPSTLKPSTSPSESPSVQATLSTSESSAEQSTSTPRTSSDPAQPTPASTPFVLPAPTASDATDHSSGTWKITGIAIIAVLFVATSITFAMFFDRLWKFIKDVICCTSRPLVSEHFLPDCENQSWDIRTLSPSPSDSIHYKSQSLCSDAVVDTQVRELPWDTNTLGWNALHRQPSRRKDHPPAA